MFKLNIVILLLTTLVISFTLAQPVTSLVSSIYDEFDDDNYDVIIDQRQNGTENFRIRVNGLNIAIPSDEFEQQQQQSQMSESDLASLLGIQTTKKPDMTLTGDKDDFTSFISFFDFKKNLKSNDKKTLVDTQSRTKDIPTESQLSGDTRKTIKNFVKGEGRKYKLLIGEKYIIPLLQYLRQHVAAENDTDE